MLRNFRCNRCGSCCYTPRLYNADIARIKKTGIEEEDFVQKDFRDIHYLKEKDKKCMFLKKGKKTACRIYNARPKICRQYPSELINRSCKPEELASDKLFQK